MWVWLRGNGYAPLLRIGIAQGNAYPSNCVKGEAQHGPNGEGWQLHARIGGVEVPLTIEESVYLGGGDTTRRTEQIVIASKVFRGDAKVNWAWKRVSGAPVKREAPELPELPDL